MSTNLTFAPGGLSCQTRFVLVNDRIPRTEQHCALCGGIVEKSHVRDSQTRLIHCDTRCFAGGARITMSGIKHRERKCSNPNCNRGIGLIRYRRSWFSKQRYCSRNCCDAFVADVPKQQQKRSATSYFEWLFLQPIGFDATSHPHKGALNIQQENGNLIVYVTSRQHAPSIAAW